MSQQLALDLGDDAQRLAGFLMSERAGNVLSPPALDGLMAAVAVCPDFIPPSEWLAAAWNGEEPAFDSEEETDAVLDAIMRRYAEILLELAGEPQRYRALLWQRRDGEFCAGDWSRGFIVGMGLRKLTWASFIASDDGNVLLPIMLHARAFDDIAPDEMEELRATGHPAPAACPCAGALQLLARIALDAAQSAENRPQRSLPVRLGREVQALLPQGRRAGFAGSAGRNRRVRSSANRLPFSLAEKGKSAWAGYAQGKLKSTRSLRRG